MIDPYVQRQLNNYEKAQSQAAKDDALYRLGTYLEIIECNSKGSVTEQDKQIVLEAALKVQANG